MGDKPTLVDTAAATHRTATPRARNIPKGPNDPSELTRRPGARSSKTTVNIGTTSATTGKANFLLFGAEHPKTVKKLFDSQAYAVNNHAVEFADIAPEDVPQDDKGGALEVSTHDTSQKLVTFAPGTAVPPRKDASVHVGDRTVQLHDRTTSDRGNPKHSLGPIDINMILSHAPTKQQKGAPRHVNYHDFDPERRSEQTIYEINVMDFNLVPEDEKPDATSFPPAPAAPTGQDPQPPMQAPPPTQMTFVTEVEEGQTILPWTTTPAMAPTPPPHVAPVTTQPHGNNTLITEAEETLSIGESTTQTFSVPTAPPTFQGPSPNAAHGSPSTPILPQGNVCQQDSLSLLKPKRPPTPLRKGNLLWTYLHLVYSYLSKTLVKAELLSNNPKTPLQQAARRLAPEHTRAPRSTTQKLTPRALDPLDFVTESKETTVQATPPPLPPPAIVDRGS